MTKWTEEDVKKLIDKANEYNSLTPLAKEINLTRQRVSQLFKSHGYEVKRVWKKKDANFF